MNSHHSALKAVQQASAAQRDGNCEAAAKWLRKARKHGLKRTEIAHILVEQALRGFQEESPESKPHSQPSVIDHLSVSAREIRSKAHAIRSRLSADHPLRENILLLCTEIGTLDHELALSIERGQFEKSAQDSRTAPGSLQELNDSWLAEIRSHAVSQLGQDLWVLERTSYKRGGFFVEFGATNGILLSNSHLLEKEFGWNGICAEPNPDFFAQLRENRLCTVSPACIGPVTGEEVEFVFADVFGGMVRDIDKDEHQAARESYRSTAGTVRLTTVSLHDFLLQHKAPRTIDYLSVDTEGSEFAILETFPFGEWDIRHITVEHNKTPQRQLIRDLLASHGYECLEAKWDDWYYKA